MPSSDRTGTAIDDPRAAIAVDLGVLRANPFLPPGTVLTGLLYDVHSGRVERVVEPEQVPSA